MRREPKSAKNGHSHVKYACIYVVCIRLISSIMTVNVEDSTRTERDEIQHAVVVLVEQEQPMFAAAVILYILI